MPAGRRGRGSASSPRCWASRPSRSNPANGVEQPRAAAFIHEELCIGCTLCIQACPVDAIVGAPKLMHTVLIDACTGCELCVPPCPVDCIEMLPLRELARRGSAGGRQRGVDPGRGALAPLAGALRVPSVRGRRASGEERDARLAAKAEGKLAGSAGARIDDAATQARRDSRRVGTRAGTARRRELSRDRHR